MPTTKPRVIITLDDDMNKALKLLSERDNVSQSAKGLELMRIATEIEEDEIWDGLARKRDTRDATYVSHKKAWGE